MACDIAEAVIGRNVRPITGEIDSYLPNENEINRRKTLVTHRVRAR